MVKLALAKANTKKIMQDAMNILHNSLRVKFSSLIFVVFISLFTGDCRAQTMDKTDSLLILLDKTIGEAERIPLMLQIADSYRDNELYRDALKYYQQLLPIYETQHDTASLALVLGNIGLMYYNLSDYDLAVDYLLKSLEQYDNIKNPIGKAKTLNWLGNVYRISYNKEIAMDHYLLSYELFKKYNYSKGLSSVLNNIGIIYFKDIKDTRKAIDFFKQSMDAAGNDSTEMSVEMQNTALVYLEMAQYDTAFIYFRKALSLDEKYNYKLGIASNCCNIANLCLKTDKIDEAKHYLDRSIIAADEIDSKAISLVVYNLYTLYYALKENTKLMWDYTYKSDTVREFLFNDQSERLIAEMQTKYETEKKEQQIKILSMENELKESKLKIRSFWLKISVLALVFIVVFILMKRQLFFTQRHLVRKNLEIVESEKKIAPSPTPALPEDVPDEKPDYAGKPDEPQNKYTGSQLSEEQKTEIKELLNNYFSKNKSYLHTDYSISDLANDLGINRNYLSQVINEKLRQNFNSLLNERRIKEARKLMSEESNQKYTIEFIAGSVGYKSRTAFNNAFKKYVGVTPSFYLKSIQSK